MTPILIIVSRQFFSKELHAALATLACGDWQECAGWNTQKTWTRSSPPNVTIRLSGIKDVCLDSVVACKEDAWPRRKSLRRQHYRKMRVVGTAFHRRVRVSPITRAGTPATIV